MIKFFGPIFQAKEKERRLKLREEKIEQQRIHQEERVKKALERAKAEPKKQVGYSTRLVYFLNKASLL